MKMISKLKSDFVFQAPLRCVNLDESRTLTITSASLIYASLKLLQATFFTVIFLLKLFKAGNFSAQICLVDPRRAGHSLESEGCRGIAKFYGGGMRICVRTSCSEYPSLFVQI